MVASSKSALPRPGKKNQMSDERGSFLTVKYSAPLHAEQREALGQAFKGLSDKIGMEIIVLDSNVDVGIQSDPMPTWTAILKEQQRTNQLLLMLVEALAESEDDMGAEPVRHLDGTLVSGSKA